MTENNETGLHLYTFDPSAEPELIIREEISNVPKPAAPLTQIRKNEKRFRAMVDLSQEINLLLSIDGCIQYASPSIRKMLGYTRKECIEKKLFSFIHPDDSSKIISEFIDLINQNAEIKFLKFRIKKNNGIWRWVEGSLKNYINDPYINCITVNLRDVTDRQESEEKLKVSEQRYKDTIELAPLGIYQCTLDGTMLSSNQTLADLLGYDDAEDILQLNIENDIYYDPLDRKKLLGEYPGKGYLADVAVQWKKKNGNPVWIQLTAKAVKDKDGNILLMEGFVRDIDKSRKIEIALKESEIKYRTIVEGMNEGLIMVDNDDRIHFVNNQLCSMLGYDKDELVGKIGHKVLHTDKEWEYIKSKNKLRQDNVSDKYEIQMNKKDGNKLWVQTSGSPLIDADGKIIGSIGVVTDISVLKVSQEKLENSLDEKELMVKEIHHRVKNNLQIISSLLKLQSGYIKDPVAIEYFKVSRDRIQSMALIHELLYKSQNLTSVNFKIYLEKLTSRFFKAYGVNNSNISLSIETGNINLGIDNAIPCGLLINELISNSLKHAFPKGKEGNINICLFRDKGEYNLIYKDDGVGFPEKLDFKNTESLGMQLVVTLTDQLEGNIVMESKKGTEFRINFKGVSYTKRI